jgi:hypothetical protein
MYRKDVDSNEERNKDRARNFIQRIQQVHQAVSGNSWRKVKHSIKIDMKNTGLIINSRLETRYGFTSTRRD